jgi:hypothetical protein
LLFIIFLGTCKNCFKGAPNYTTLSEITQLPGLQQFPARAPAAGSHAARRADPQTCGVSKRARQFGTLQVNHLPAAALLSLLQDTARIKESRAALVPARRTDPTSGCPAKIEEPGWRRRTATLATP